MMETCVLCAPTGKFLPISPSHSLSNRISPVPVAGHNTRVLIENDFKGLFADFDDFAANVMLFILFFILSPSV